VSELIEVESIRRLAIKPGEILVVRIPLRGDAEIAAVRDQLQGLLPDGTTVMVTGPDVDMHVVTRTEADRIADAVSKATENPGHAVYVSGPDDEIAR